MRAYRRVAAITVDAISKGGEYDMQFLPALIASLSSDREEGQGLAEYALILALIAIVAIVALLFLGGAISGILSTVGNSL
jgi:pilus assembly protein Flp/PilA